MRDLLWPAMALLVGATAPKADVVLLAWSMDGDLALIQESTQAHARSSLGYRVVGPGVAQKHFEISRESARGEQARTEEIAPDACRATLIELRDLLRAKRFKGIQLQGEACKADRSAAIVVAPEQAGAADAAELEPSSAGDALVRGDWKLRLQATALTIAGPKERKQLRLPRPISPAAAHVLLSPSRKLLLILESVDAGEQILAAGFASKTGELADFE